MEMLREYIQKNGKIKTEDILDVKSFLNMQVDADLMADIGKDFAARYQDYDFDAFVTVETSGIAPSVFAAQAAGKPLVIIKKEVVDKEDKTIAQHSCHSYTKDSGYYLTVLKEFIENKKIILLDDFLAEGNVVQNVEKLLNNNNSTLVATGIVISKNFQPGYKRLTDLGYDLYCQAQIEKLDVENDTIIFGK